MRCADFTRRWQVALDQRRLPDNDPELARHAQQCPACAARLYAWQEISSVLRSEHGQPTANLTVHTAAGGRHPASPGVGTLLGTSLAIVAALLLLIGIGGLFSGSFPDSRRSQDVARAPRVAFPAVSGLPAEASSDSQLTSESYRRLWQSLMARLQFGELQELQSVDQLSVSFRPIAATLNAAFGAVRRSLPVGGTDGDSA